VENGFDGVALLNKQFIITAVSRSTSKILGFTVREMVGGDAFSYIHPDDLKNVKKILKVLLSKKKVRLETRVRKNDGKYIWLGALCTNLLDIPEVEAIVVSFRDISLRKKAEEDLKLSESRFRALFLQSPLSIQVFSPEGETLEVNKSWEKLWNAPPELVKGYNILNDHQLEEKGVMPYIRRGFAGEIVETPIISYDPNDIGKSGRVRYVKALIFPIKNKAGKILQVVLKHVDVTDVIESEENFTVLAQTSPDAIFVTDAYGIIGYGNPAIKKMFGFTYKSMVGQPFTLFFTPNSAIEATTLFQQMKKGQTINNVILTALCSDKSEFPVEISASPLIWKGNFRGVQCIMRDISERKKVEENLFFLAETSKILSASFDYRKTIQEVADLAITLIADWCAVELLDNEKLQLIAIAHKRPDHLQLAKQLMTEFPLSQEDEFATVQVLKTDKPVIYPKITDDILQKLAHNKKHLALMRKLKISSGMTIPLFLDGKSVGGISFVITESKKNYNETDLMIAKEVAHRISLTIQNARLYEKTKKAVTLRDEFISVSSHELKTPLTSLKLYTQLLKSRIVKYQKRGLESYFEKIERQTTKLLTLVNDLLSVSKLQHGRLEFVMDEFDLNHLIKETALLVQGTKPSHTITIRGKVTQKIYGDEFRITQVLTNLLTNAIKFSPQADKVAIHIKENAKKVSVSVEDFGIGIDRHHQDKLFSQFYRVTDPKEKTFPGLGMGLFIASQIIERHQGTLSVLSKKGKGSIFTFTLPKAKKIN